MSWDGMIMRFGEVARVQDLPDDFQPEPIGSIESVLDALRRIFPDGNHNDGRSLIEGNQFWLELSYGCHTDAAGMVSAIGVRSNADTNCLDVLRRACEAFQSRLFDCQTGELADLSEVTLQSMGAYSEWRDRIISIPDPSAEE